MHFKTNYYSKQIQKARLCFKNRSTTLNKWNYANHDLFNLTIIIPLIMKQLNYSTKISKFQNSSIWRGAY